MTFTRLFTFLFFSSSLLFAQENELISYPKDSGIKMLKVGDYKKGELDSLNLSSQWWGLFEEGKQSYIKKVKLKLNKLEPDIQYDWEYSISVENNAHCKILISNLGLEERTIVSFTSGDVLRNNNFTFEFGPYHTYLSSTLIEEMTENEVERYLIQINFNTNGKLITQNLFEFPNYYSTSQLMINLEWAGDLDKDGKTDMLIQIPTLPNNETGYSIGLFLSSMAKGLNLLKLVAYYTDSGC